MREEDLNSKDEKLAGVLREARAMPSLPPRFRENVWRRIEEGEIASVDGRGWLGALAAWALRPRFALTAAVVLVSAGAFFGVRQGHLAARHEAQSRYIASVAPNSLR